MKLFGPEIGLSGQFCGQRRGIIDELNERNVLQLTHREAIHAEAINITAKRGLFK